MVVGGTKSLSCSLNSLMFSLKGDRTEESIPAVANSFCCSDNFQV